MLIITWESPGLRQHRGVMIKDSISLHEAEESSETWSDSKYTRSFPLLMFSKYTKLTTRNEIY